MTLLRDRFTCVLVCAALVACIASASGAQGLSTQPSHKPSPFSIEKGKAGLDTSAVAPAKGATPPKPATSAPGQKPALIKAEEALDQNRPKEAVDFAVQAVKDEPQSGHAWFVLARAQQAAGNTPAAIAAGEKASTFASVRASALYNLACVYALNKDKDNALTALENAKRAGFADRDQMMKDPDLALLRGDKRFQLPGSALRPTGSASISAIIAWPMASR
ncbi:MAG TPA: tetratricopeptide repeat protein [Candidatus Krumholzibacteria bacterium]|nr:tetratricopeptide repeat protein [Candidatus Krumholzibacteria bacterium]